MTDITPESAPALTPATDDTSAFDAAVAALPEVTSDANPDAEAPAPAVVPEATPVLQQTPSSDAPAEPVAVEDAPTKTLEDAAAALLSIVDEGHKLGDRALDAAREELRAILGA